MVERKKLIFAGVFAGAALALNWLFEGETSPFHEHFIWDVRLPNFWARLNTIPYTLALVFSSELVYWAVFIAQWLLFGLLFHWLLGRKPLQ
jgi:hypothetical protein